MSDRFEDDLRTTLAAGAASVDQRTRDELARRRRLVLDAVEHNPSRRWLWLPVGGVIAAVAVALLATVLVQPYWRGQMPEPAVADSGDVDMEILLAEDSFELYEDLEFYEWLSEVGDAGDAGDAG